MSKRNFTTATRKATMAADTRQKTYQNFRAEIKFGFAIKIEWEES